MNVEKSFNLTLYKSCDDIINTVCSNIPYPSIIAAISGGMLAGNCKNLHPLLVAAPFFIGMIGLKTWNSFYDVDKLEYKLIGLQSALDAAESELYTAVKSKYTQDLKDYRNLTIALKSGKIGLKGGYNDILVLIGRIMFESILKANPPKS